MPNPADPISTYIINHNLVQLLLWCAGLTTYAALRKQGAAAKQLVIGTLAGITEIHAALCKFWFDCRENTRHYARPLDDMKPNSTSLKLRAKV